MIAAVTSLTSPECKDVEIISNGQLNPEIAPGLSLTETTMKNYVGRMLSKPEALDRVLAAVSAYMKVVVTP